MTRHVVTHCPESRKRMESTKLSIRSRLAFFPEEACRCLFPGFLPRCRGGNARLPVLTAKQALHSPHINLRGSTDMPFTRISLLAGKSPDYLAAVSDSLDRALVEAFEVPKSDRFVAIHQHQPNELIFDRHYRGGPRSDDFILFHITTGKARSHETKQRFYRRLTECLAESPGVRKEDIMVVIANSTFEDWSFASGISAAAESQEVSR
jgi:phenylpyruvate tautomerase PptA (4-oxalocrotonate tautomerase family)